MRRSLVIAAMLAMTPGIAFGQTGWGRIFKNGPVAEFRGGDWDLFWNSLLRAADGGPGGDPVTWSNAQTSAHGDVKVDKGFERAGLGECRDLSGQASARARTSSFHITLCRQPGGEWRIPS